MATTLTKLKKLADNIGFVHRLEKLGFILAPEGFWFYREREKFIDYIGFELKLSKCYMTVPVACYGLDIIDHCDMSKFPVGFEKNIPFYSSTYVNEEYGVEIGSDPWGVETEGAATDSFDQIIELLESSAESWFVAIDSNLALYESFTINFRKSEKSQLLKKKLLGEG